MAKSEDLHGDKTLYELRRQYHCMAYNMLVAVITCTQNKVQFYTGFLFKEDPLKVCIDCCIHILRTKCYYLHVIFFYIFINFVCLLQGQFLWDNLIDHDRSYHFEVELEVAINAIPVYNCVYAT